MGIIENLANRIIYKPLADYLINRAKENQGVEKMTGTPVLRDPFMWQSPTVGYRRTIGSSTITPQTLRSFSTQYDVARACINRRKRQINGLEWDIVSARTDDKKDYKTVVEPMKLMFKNLGGYKVRFREFLDLIVEDLLTLDGVALEKIYNRGGEITYLKPIDSALIYLKVTDSGDTPMPPDPAYAQVIRGKEVATWTADEMYYEMMNPRTSTPYGLSPIESLILGISAALKSELFNLGMLTEGNIPEGFFSVPDTWQPNQIKEFQATFDAAMSGDATMVNKLRFVPQGSYQATKKPEDMRYKELQEWLMKKTCMLFEIQPQELGFTDTVNKATGEVQFDIGQKTGLQPLANFLEEIFTDVIQIDMGHPELKFKFTGLDNEDEKAKAEVNEILIRSGQRTVDELRTDDNLKPLGVSKPFVIGSPTFIDDESQQQKADQAAAQAEATAAAAAAVSTDPKAEEADPEAAKTKRAAEMLEELRSFRKYALNKIRNKKAIRPFESDIIPAPALVKLNAELAAVTEVEAARSIFKDFMTDYQLDFLADLSDIKDRIDSIV